MKNSTNSNNDIFLLKMTSEKAFSRKSGLKELKAIFSKLWDICRLAFELYYIKFKIREISSSVKAAASNEENSLLQVIKKLYSKFTTFKEQYVTE